MFDVHVCVEKFWKIACHTMSKKRTVGEEHKLRICFMWIRMTRKVFILGGLQTKHNVSLAQCPKAK